MADPFALLEAVCSRLGARAEGYGLQALTPPEQTALLVWWAKGIVDNGGFDYFYEGASNALEVADAFGAIGFPEAAQAFRQSTEVFPGGSPHAGHDERQAWLNAHAEEVKPLFHRLASVIWNLGDAPEAAVEEYIKRNAAAFRDLDKITQKGKAVST